jgi:hypothetical protein
MLPRLRPLPLAGLLPALAGIFCLTACESFKQAPTEVPNSVKCTTVHFSGDSESLRKALAESTPGGCVILVTETYEGNFEVKPGVTIAAGTNQHPVIRGMAPEAPAVKLQGGEGNTVLQGVSVVGSAGTGVGVIGGPVAIRDVTIEKSAGPALVATCKGVCTEAQLNTYSNLRTRESKIGAVFVGARVKWDGGESTGNKSTTVAGGTGIVAHSGAQIEIQGVTVQNNEATGVVVDGNEGTRANLVDLRVIGNGERGVWAQYMKGDTAFHVQRGTFQNNALVSLGMASSTGVLVEGAQISGTSEKPVIVNLQKSYIGDGIIFDHTSGSVSGVVLEANARAAALIDAPPDRLSFEFSRIVEAENGFKVVVQHDDGNLATVESSVKSATATPLAVPEKINIADVAPQ